MSRSLASVSALLASVALMIAGAGIMNMLLPLRAEMEAFATLSIGLLGSAHALGFMLGCLFGPSVISRAGHIRTFAGLVGMVSSLFLLHAMVVEPVAWWMLRALTGACFATIFMVVESWLNARASNATRGAIFCAYAVISHISGSIGQALVSFGEPDRWTLFSIGSILISLSALPVALARAEAPAIVETARLRIAPLWKSSPVGFAGCLIAGFAGGAFWSLGPSFAFGATGDAKLVPLLMTAPVVAAAIVQWPVGLLSDRIDRRPVIALSSTLAAAASLFLATASSADAATLAIGFAIFGAGFIPISALSVANANDFAPPSAAVETAAGLLLVWSSGSIAGPIAASLAMKAGGPGGLFLLIAAAFAALAAFSIWRRTQRSSPPASERVTFTEAVIAAETVGPIKPEIETKAREDAADEIIPAAA